MQGHCGCYAGGSPHGVTKGQPRELYGSVLAYLLSTTIGT